MFPELMCFVFVLFCVFPRRVLRQNVCVEVGEEGGVEVGGKAL